MASIFSEVLNMSMTGSVVILIVMLARLILKRSPKVFSYALWSVVLFRLLCPVAFTAPVSVLNAFETEVKPSSDTTSVVYYIPAQVEPESEFTFVPAENQSGTQQDREVVSNQPERNLMGVFSGIWIVGVTFMLLYSAVQYVLLRRKLMGNILYHGNVYLADYIDTPFVLGIFRPKIYLPTNIPSNERKYIIAHERHHIRRCDHIIKLLAYGALCIHWFNPLVWAAFILAGKDMEMSCDEAVIKQLGTQIRADYSVSLLRLATHKKIIAGMPLAFGEGDTKGRVINMAKWKKPKLWVSLICFVLCAAVLVACAVNPETTGSADGSNTTEITGIVTSDNDLNIRQEPSTNSTVVGQYTNGTRITILERKDGWGRTDLGWVSMNYVTTAEDTTVVDPSETVPVVQELNIRKEPDISSAVVGTYSNGTTITILETKEGWGRTDQGWVHMDYVKTTDGISVVDVGDFQPAKDGSVILTDTDLVQYGTLKMLLPSGFAAKYENDTLVLTKDSVAVGGIRQWIYPDFQPSDIVELRKKETGAPIGYMSGSSAYGDTEYEIFWDGNPDGLCEQHTFFTDGDVIYDVWYDENQISDGIAERFLKTIAINADPVVATAPGEQEAFTKCRAVLETVQSGSCQILVEQNNEGNQGPSGYLTNYYRDGSNWLSITEMVLEGTNITEAGDYYSRQALMRVNDIYYSNEGHWGERGDINWSEGGNEVWLPWLVKFEWNENIIAYIDTLTDEDGECVMLRVDEKYIESDEYDPHYFLYFNFDPDGNFVNAQLQVNLFRENELAITESIVSMDPEVVNAEIQKEYQKAIG